MTTPEKRIDELLEFVLDGSCADQQRQEFAALVDEHPELIKGLANEVFIHSLLLWQSENISREVHLFDESHSTDPSSPGLPIAERPQSGDWLRRTTTWAVAAALLIGGGFVFWQTGQQSSWQEVAVAKIIEVDNVSWEKESTALKPGDLVVPGRLRTDAGDFTMQFRTGPVVHVIGAVSMMVESDMLVHLDSGQATARVPDSLKGFTIKTPVINVIDQGTEFGVATRDNGFTDVVVFDGEVDLDDYISNENDPTRLVQGQAARIDRQGAMQRIMQVSCDPQGSWWTADYPGSGMHVIQEVRDNIPPADQSEYFCYQINYNGLDEDVFAYVDDHPHQWNGIDETGLPSYLRGADFVKTFNDYRYLDDFQMTVILAQPAHLYLFFDDRVPPPKWLTDQFEDTGDDIGLDEGPWPAHVKVLRPDLPVFENAVGPGKSIDNTFSVWHRRCDDTTPVVLGIVGEELQARAMYGIAATPLNKGQVARLTPWECVECNRIASTLFITK